MYEIWIKKNNTEYKLDDGINMSYDLVEDLVRCLKSTEEFAGCEIEIRVSCNLN